ncbi:peptidoglycan -binding protein [Frigidibacter sp. RF13]|uniref:peptidoglycan -binding protein n=1 Tax=Frigidibacter sp. RF13 TaxID=2997340 RepID=UPI00226E7278|nr:peptidoglycan -binding protein [Frigidibacter sp. RF13]MCY1126118.1 peptidoglycan -binding protein [Frigidibacter sp. RF13]
MAGPGRGRSGQAAAIWPGFLDLMTSLVMVLMFVLTIFMILQFALRETISNQGDELADLNQQLAGLADSLGVERARTAELQTEVGTLTATLAARVADLSAADGQIDAFEAQVAALLSAQAANRATISAQEEAARLAEAKRAALEALAADLKAEGEKTAAKLSETEAARLTEAAAAAALREKLKSSEDELTAMTLALEAQRKKAEETLTLLAAAEAAKKELDAAKLASLSEADRQKALLALAEAELGKEKASTAEAARKVTLLNEQVAALRGQLGALQDLLDASAAKDADAKVQIEALGSQLNSALARVAAEEKRRAELEEAEKKRLAEEAQAAKDEAKELAKYRSEFFGKLSEVLSGREGVRVVGDRFVFSSEVLFEPGAADLSPEGKSQIAGVVATLQEVAAVIPPEVGWIIRVDGHTDNLPLSGFGEFRDNWELSQARALSVVRYMQDDLGFPPERLAATGFGEYQPVADGDAPEARAQNRRIELKLTER